MPNTTNPAESPESQPDTKIEQETASDQSPEERPLSQAELLAKTRVAQTEIQEDLENLNRQVEADRAELGAVREALGSEGSEDETTAMESDLVRYQETAARLREAAEALRGDQSKGDDNARKPTDTASVSPQVQAGRTPDEPMTPHEAPLDVKESSTEQMAELKKQQIKAELGSMYDEAIQKGISPRETSALARLRDIFSGSRSVSLESVNQHLNPAISRLELAWNNREGEKLALSRDQFVNEGMQGLSQDIEQLAVEDPQERQETVYNREQEEVEAGRQSPGETKINEPKSGTGKQDENRRLDARDAA